MDFVTTCTNALPADQETELFSSQAEGSLIQGTDSSHKKRERFVTGNLPMRL
jgi:hypothetical protein